MKYSIIVPVYNRPDEVEELLESLAKQKAGDFDIHIVEDGSTVPCREVCDRFAETFGSRLHYYEKENGGPGEARNYGAAHAEGDYFIVLDSDVVLPEGYLSAIDAELAAEPCDAFGGPDRAHPDFTPVQKAISYAMTSFFTTGGIRGGRKKLDKFYPRSFNMGVSRELWRRLGGFRAMRFGEDIDFSLRIFKEGASCRLFPNAWVWHKRRTDFRKFFRQVYNSGVARINLHLLHPGSMKLVHMLPAMFTAGCVGLAVLLVVGLILLLCGHGSVGKVFCWIAIGLPLLYSLLIFIDSSIKNRSLKVGLLSVPASFIQLFGYGSGFLSAARKRLVLKRAGEGFDFENNQKFYS